MTEQHLPLVLSATRGDAAPVDPAAPPPSAAATGRGNASVAMFLALYLLLLAFFIVLNALSTLEESRIKKVLNSLQVTFAEFLDPTDLSVFTSSVGDVIGPKEFTDHLTGLFEAAIPAGRVEMVEPGELLQMQTAADSLFLVGSAEMRSAHRALIGRLVAAMSRAPDGYRYAMDFIVNVPPAEGGGLPADLDGLQAQRAMAMVDIMVDHGLPQHLLTIAVAPGDTPIVTLRFSVTRTDTAVPDRPPRAGGDL